MGVDPKSLPDDLVAARVEYARGKLALDVDQDWVDRMVCAGREWAQKGIDLSVSTSGLIAAYRRMHSLIALA